MGCGVVILLFSGDDGLHDRGKGAWVADYRECS